MKIIAGLGNPGKRYEQTRHNVGFDVVQGLAEHFGIPLRRSLRFRARMAKARLGDEELLLVQPQTFMNASGTAVGRMMRYRKLAVSDLIAVVDDAAIDLGRIRIRIRGSAGGHNGLQSLIDGVGDDAFTRVRLGVGQTEGAPVLKGFVLGKFAESERSIAEDMIRQAVRAVLTIVQSGTGKAMNAFNSPRQVDGRSA